MNGVLGDERAADRERDRVPLGLDRCDLAELLDDAGEHSRASYSKGSGVRQICPLRPWTGTYRALPPIRTFTVGPGVPPGQPADGFGRVADCHRRFGIAPTPEHAFMLANQCAMPDIPRPM
ncbi:hypothetical protein GCM10010182_25310 [Actinomadura cremea]|nr:hypothetical protein GCM10010182_25310 [Actinomadura cremea]